MTLLAYVQGPKNDPFSIKGTFLLYILTSLHFIASTHGSQVSLQVLGFLL